MKKHIVLVMIMLMPLTVILAQEKTNQVTNDTIPAVKSQKKTKMKPDRRWGDGGAGLGLDYGGLIGVKASFYPIKYMAVFGAVGWEIVGIGWNVGILGRIIPADGKHGTRPYLKVMYGVNGATQVKGKNGYDEMFYGLTVGAGLELRFGKIKKNGINIDLNVPFRSPEFFDMVSRIKNDPQIDLKNDPWPVTISVGYMVEF
ncbi:MAG: hypothetical protein EOM90_15965 [Alphaproteobacteria bacterium]|nr:hypothetical protein [Alphaproteobacteria bacterium]